jgi:hypothetical protein
MAESSIKHGLQISATPGPFQFLTCSHVSSGALQFAKENKVFVAFPAHTVHILQALHVAYEVVLTKHSIAAY